MEKQESEIEFLGQKLSYPKTIYGAVFSLGLFILLGFSLYTILVLAKSENLNIVTEDIIVGGYGGKTDFKRKNIVQHQFWTPSRGTYESQDLSGWVEDIKDIEKRNAEFGTLLTKNDSIYGYRRYEIYGQGRSNPKKGMWWVINADKELSTKNVADLYQRFWDTDNSVYIESYYFNGGLK